MNQTSDSTFAERLDGKVNLAEDKAKRYYKTKNIKLIRCGFDQFDNKTKIETDDFWKVPLILRKMPDYLFIDSGCYFLEVKGCRENVGLKVEDIKMYDFWDKICPIRLFVYSVSFSMCYVPIYKRVREELLTPSFATKKVYPDNKKEYYSLPVKELALVGEFHRW